MTILKDSNYWKDYNQKRREYLTQKKKESRNKLKELVVDRIKVVDTSLKTVVDNQLNISVVDQPLNNLVVDIKNSSVVDNKLNLVVDIEKNNLVVDQLKIVDIQAYNEQIFKRAGTREELRFYSFLDGKKIVRTMCGCNNYDWCLDNCQYFTWWRNKEIGRHE